MPVVFAPLALSLRLTYALQGIVFDLSHHRHPLLYEASLPTCRYFPGVRRHNVADDIGPYSHPRCLPLYIRAISHCHSKAVWPPSRDSRPALRVLASPQHLARTISPRWASVEHSLH